MQTYHHVDVGLAVYTVIVCEAHDHASMPTLGGSKGMCPQEILKNYTL